MFKIQNKKSFQVLDFSVFVIDILVPPSADLDIGIWHFRVSEKWAKSSHISQHFKLPI